MMKEAKLMLSHAPQEEWGSVMCVEMAIGGLGGGAFIASALIDFWVGALAAFLVCAIGKGVLLLADLGKPARFLKVFLRPRKSWISFGAWSFLLFCLTGAAYLLAAALMDPSALVTVLKVLALLFAACVISYDGLCLSASVGVSAWHDGPVTPLFAASALSAGFGCVIAVVSAVSPLAFSFVELAMVVAALVSALLTGVTMASYAVVLRKGSTGDRESAWILLHSSQRGAFVWGAGVAGVIAPLAVYALLLVGVAIPLVAVQIAGVLQVIALFCLRFSVIKSGVYTPAMPVNPAF